MFAEDRVETVGARLDTDLDTNKRFENMLTKFPGLRYE